MYSSCHIFFLIMSMRRRPSVYIRAAYDTIRLLISSQMPINKCQEYASGIEVRHTRRQVGRSRHINAAPSYTYRWMAT